MCSRQDFLIFGGLSEADQ